MHVRINPQAVECVASAAKIIALDTWFGQMIAIFKHRKAMWSIKSLIIKKWRKMCSFCLPWLVSGGTGEWVGAFPVVGVVETGWSAVPDDILYGRNRGEKAGECE